MKKNIIAIITLTLITIIAGVLLGYVYEITKEPIEQQNLRIKLDAYHKVFVTASDFVEGPGTDISTASDVLAAAGYSDETIDECLVAVDANNSAIGYVMTITTSEGYGGDIKVSVGIGNDGTLYGVEILSIQETAGLGMKATTDEFKNQFKDKQVAGFTYTKTGASAEYEIDAISGATITTNAMVNAVNASLTYFKAIGGGVNE